MPIEFFSSDDSDFSETDISLRRGVSRSHVRQRSHSRHRHYEPRATLAPVQTRVYRSASTGGSRRHQRDPQVPNVTIINDGHLESRPQSRRVHQEFTEQPPARSRDRFDDVVINMPPPSPGHRGRATSVSRDHSPYPRDYELAIGQYHLEHENIRQDMDIRAAQKEIERLERKIRKNQEKGKDRVIDVHDVHEKRIIKNETELYEAELAERLAKLRQYESKYDADEAERKAEERYQLKRLAEERRAAAEAEEIKHKLQDERLRDIARLQDEKAQRDKLMKEEKWKELARLKEEQEERQRVVQEEKWKELQRQKEEEEEREKLIKEIKEEELRKAKEAEEKRMKELAMKAAAVEEWKLEQERIKQREAEAAARKAKEFRDHLQSLGYSEAEIDAIINKKKDDKKKEEEKKKDEGKKESEKDVKLTWIKVHRKHLLPETLIHFGLPWEWDEGDSNYIIIKKWITEDFQEELFAHTRTIRERKVIAETSHSRTELRVNDRNKDRLYLVRRKSPSRRVRLGA